jgi:hypothetical protein
MTMSFVQQTDFGIVRSDSTSGWTSVADYERYEDAQRAVDRLSDEKFPVENTEIVGRDLRLVERVLGRITYGRAAGAGALTGAWFGVLIGVIVGLFASGSEWVGLVGGLLIGAVWGALFGLLAHWLTGGRRDFASMRGLVAARYDVMVVDAEAERARQLLVSKQ